MAPSKYDDPDAISKFLKVMGGSSSATKVESGSQPAKSSLNPETPAFSPNGRSTHNTTSQTRENNAPQSAAQPWNATPSWQPPSQSPFPQATPGSKTGHLDLVQDENGLVTENPAPVYAVQESVSTLRDTNTRKGVHRSSTLTPTQYRLLRSQKPGFGQLTEAKLSILSQLTESKLSELSQKTQGYMDNVVENFRKYHQPVTLQGQGEANDASSENASIPFPEMDETPINDEVNQSDNVNTTVTPVKSLEWQQEKATAVPFNTLVADLGGHQMQDDALSPFPTFTETAVSKPSSDMELSDPASQVPTTPIAKIVVKDERGLPAAVAPGADSTSKEPESSEGVAVDSKPNNTDTSFTHSPTIVVTPGTETDDSLKEDDSEEDRENLTRFKAWGTPINRPKPKSRQRTVILSGLPRGADYRFVQSFVHGGAVECLRLVPGNPDRPTISAHVTFVSPDSCDRYYDKYPNGFDVRNQGKKWPVFVHKRDGVDIIAGTLEGHLECGATRVVKVNNADDDWGIVALNKLAEGKTGIRQVEAVHDTYHNGTRTITFRFASIPHAVQFKGMLIHSPDWEGCHVEFGEDPCAKAIGFHSD